VPTSTFGTARPPTACSPRWSRNAPRHHRRLLRRLHRTNGTRAGGLHPGSRRRRARAVSILLDHGASLEQCVQAIRYGCTDVMFDGSRLPLEENLDQTGRIVRAAHAPRLRRASSATSSGRRSGRRLRSPLRLTDPSKPPISSVRRADYLAVPSVRPRRLPGEPHLELDLLREIRRRWMCPWCCTEARGCGRAAAGGYRRRIAKINVSPTSSTAPAAGAEASWVAVEALGRRSTSSATATSPTPSASAASTISTCSAPPAAPERHFTGYELQFRDSDRPLSELPEDRASPVTCERSIPSKADSGMRMLLSGVNPSRATLTLPAQLPAGKVSAVSRRNRHDRGAPACRAGSRRSGGTRNPARPVTRVRGSTRRAGSAPSSGSDPRLRRQIELIQSVPPLHASRSVSGKARLPAGESRGAEALLGRIARTEFTRREERSAPALP